MSTIGYNALTVTSPMCCGGESKNQDRACWHAAVQVAGVCDGVSSSPFAADGAELVTALTPALFQGNIEDRLRMASDLLVVRRLEKQHAGPSLPADTTASMREMLLDIATERLAQGYQTTLVAANFTQIDNAVTAAWVRCGDSVFLAFAPNGMLHLASPSDQGEPNAKRRDGDVTTPGNPGGLRFGPRDELLVKVIGAASDEPQTAAQVGLSRASA